MNTVDSSVREFSIAFYPPNNFNTIFFCAALAVTLAVGVWLGMRFYLHLYGVRTEGTVTESRVKTSRVKNGEFSASKESYTRYLTVEFTGPDGVKRTVKGKNFSREADEGSKDVPRVGGKVPVLYIRSIPGYAIYYDPVWHYLVPATFLAFGLLFTFMAASFCYKDIRVSNNLSLSGWTEEQYRDYQDVIIECDQTIHHNPNDAAAFERRGDAQFAIIQFRDAIADYSEALRHSSDRPKLLLKRSKAKWLNGDDFNALQDWLKYRWPSN